jgi:hypothetical protein
LICEKDVCRAFPDPQGDSLQSGSNQIFYHLSAFATEQAKLFTALIRGNPLAGNLASSAGNIRVLARTDSGRQAEFGSDVLDSRKDGPTRINRQGEDRRMHSSSVRRIGRRKTSQFARFQVPSQALRIQIHIFNDY